MSSVYDTEPQPTASVIVHTTGGEVAVEIFAKQTPLTSRNFLQHCLDGYYDNTTFHRLVPGFVLQGGDPTGTGDGGESIFDGGALAGDLDPWPMEERRGQNAGPQGVGFKDEFHSRLKFNRRGLLGMANEGKRDTNGSQFFFTLDKADELNGKNTMFGRVSGTTIYNLVKMGQADVQEGSERPVYPVVIKTIEILTNPFTDMRKHERLARPNVRQPSPTNKKKSKRKKGVNKTLLSFGDDMEDAETENIFKDARKPRQKSAKTDESTLRDNVHVAKTAPQEAWAQDEPTRQTVLPSRAMLASAVPQKDTAITTQKRRDSISESELEQEAPPPKKKKKQSELEKTNAEIAALKASMRRTVQAEPAAKETRPSALESLIPANVKRGKKLGRNYGLSSHDEKVLKLLGKFQSKLGDHVDPAEPASASAGLPDKKDEQDDQASEGETKEEEHAEVCDLHFIANCQSCRPWDKDEEEENSDAEDWMAHTLNCEADKLGKDLSYRKKAEEELIVIDPREKARTLKEEKRAARDGRSSKAWDQARHAKMARASALSGRGAR